MALEPIKIDGSETGVSGAEKINNGFTQCDSNLTKINNNTANITTNTTNIGLNATGITTLDGRVDDIEAGTAEVDKVAFNLLAASPSEVEGTLYYNSAAHTLVIKNDIAGTNLNLGHEIVSRCYNPSTTLTINEGDVVAITAIQANDVLEIIPASAADLTTAVIFGVATSTFLPETLGMVTKMGAVHSVDTKGIVVNGAIYLSETDGQLTGVSPAISSLVGYVIQPSTIDTKDGVIYVDTRSIVSLPNVVAYMNQNVPTAAADLGTIGMFVTHYDADDSGAVIMEYSTTDGTITAPADGIYDMTIDFGTNYTDIGNTVQHLLVEIMADNGVDLIQVGQYNKEVAKNSSSTNGSMTKTFKGNKDWIYYMAMSCPDDTFQDFVLENVSFSLKSIDIR